MKKFVALVFLFVAASPVIAGTGGSLSDWYLIPAVAHLPGKHGTFWQTDVAIVNPYTWRSITIDIWFHAIDQDNTDADMTSVTIGAGDQVTLPDVVMQTFGVSRGSGALWLQTGDGAYFTVNARTYTGTTGTYGLMENGQRSLTSGSQYAFISGIKNDSPFRTNVGAASASTRSINILIEAYDNAGRFKGEGILSLDPWGMTQIAVDSFAGDFSNGYLILTAFNPSDDVQWVGYATPIDNNSGDSTFCEARTDAQYTWASPDYDLTGWWEGATAGPLGDGTTWVYILQDGAEVSAWDCDLSEYPGSEDAFFSGYMDGSQMVVEEGYSRRPACWSDRIVGGQASVTANSVSGTITVSGDCANGTQTFALTPSKKKSMPPPASASHRSPATPERPRHLMRR